MKSYGDGYPLNTSDQDAMIRYVEEWSRRLPKQGCTTGWWSVLPAEVEEYSYAFVSDSFKASVTSGIATITERLGGVHGSALRVHTLLTQGEEFLANGTPDYEMLDTLFFATAA